MTITPVIVGPDHVNTLGIIRSLGESGIKPIVLIINSASHNSWVLKSRYVDSRSRTCNDSKQIIRTLVCFALKERAGKRWIIPSGDDAVALVDKERELLKNYYHLPDVECELKGEKIKLRQLMCKTQTLVFAKKSGFGIPKTFLFDFSRKSENLENLERLFLDDFPLLIRPASQLKKDCDYTIVYSLSELKDVLSHSDCGFAIIQQYIQKDEELGICGIGFGREKEPFAPAVIHKVRTSVISPGSTAYGFLSTDDNDGELLKCAKNFIHNIGYKGIFDIECIRKGNDFYFIECNMRNGAYGYVYSRFGFNLPTRLIGKRIDDRNVYHKHSKVPTIHFMNEFSDIRNMIKGNISIRNWIMDLFRTQVLLTINIKDPIPFFARVLNH